jgi:hypothetical protein
MVKLDNSSRIAQQIENTADYYPPATYSGTSYYGIPTSYLTYYNELVLNSDSLADQYVPLSTVPQRGRNPKLFAVGVIPPSANVSGQLLSREASIRNLAGVAPTYIPTASQNSIDRSQYVKDLLDWACGGTKGRNENDPVYKEVTEGRDVGRYQKSYSSCGDLAHWMLYRMGVRSDYVNRTENGGWKSQKNISNLASSPVAEVPNANTQYKAGDIAVIWSESNGTDAHTFVVVEQSGNTLTVAEYGQPGGAIHNRTIKIQDGKPFIGNRQIQRVVPLDKAIELARQSGQLDSVGLPNKEFGYPEDSPKWDGIVAGDARRILEKTANTPLSAEDISSQYTAAQTVQTLLIQKALEGMQNTPPLRLMVNPQSFSVKGEKIVSDSGWSRNGGTIVEHWGNAQEKISASGKVAGFYAVDIFNGVSPGLTRMARNASQSWQNFQSLQLFYANNGGVHTADPTTSANMERNLAMLGSIYIYYDSIMYIGSFDSFSITESDVTPHTVDYSFEYTVRAAFLLDNPSDSDQQRARSSSGQR